jgi:hypothetical protein
MIFGSKILECGDHWRTYPYPVLEFFKQSMGARNRVGIGLSYLPARARICKCLWSLGIDSEESISPAYVAWRVGTTIRVVVMARQDGNRCLDSLKGLQIRAQAI